MAHVIVHETGKAPARHEVRGSTTFGRAIDCDICLSDTALSRAHFAIEPGTAADEVEWVVVDLGSSNGTKVGGERFLRRALSDGDSIEAGSTRVQFQSTGGAMARPQGPEEVVPVEAMVAELLARSERGGSEEPPIPRPRANAASAT